ncbi:citrate lyase subunit gamma (acyl carrier protein) [Caloramator quimbayensis]|uniref:Citrate lyase subunit gamma (Acyl carrier protein) n=1 Tax=Caloramator quimbayensis TaxID=1147123 RepID=A0A1T4XMD4_9CLOT|nr:citrate lyase acyl carrier protein [Caloramator quimbayensis]SKA90338.1 citrate lyase subunit gamma (acyl carrier protein) [Caloramator quimbayensis]
MEIKRIAKCGTFESNDIYVIVEPNSDGGVEINLESIVMKQFGEQIKKTIDETVKSFGIKSIKITAKDRGALDYTIKSRVETAIKRAL